MVTFRVIVSAIQVIAGLAIGSWTVDLHTMKSRSIVEICCMLLVLLLVYTASSKLMDIANFKRELNSQPFPTTVKHILLLVLPAIELLIAAGLAFPLTRKAGLVASSLLFFLFSLYAGLILTHAFYKVPCACGGLIRQLTWPQHFAMNIIFLLLSVTATIFQFRMNSLARKQGMPKT